MPENLNSVLIVYPLGLWEPERLKSGSSDFGRLDSGRLDRKGGVAVKGGVADYDIFNSKF